MVIIGYNLPITKKVISYTTYKYDIITQVPTLYEFGANEHRLTTIKLGN